MTAPINNGRTAWSAASVTSTLVVFVLGSIGAIVNQSYTRDQTRMEERLKLLENERVRLAENRGETTKRIDQVQALADMNRARIEASFKELDDKLQRETNLKVGTVDEKLQGEIARSRQERVEAGNVRDARLAAVESWMVDMAKILWTREDQVEFQRAMGLRSITQSHSGDAQK